jgi:hypothetical protein
MKKLAAPMKSFGNLILMTVICIVIFWVFMALQPAKAETCNEDWCKINGRLIQYEMTTDGKFALTLEITNDTNMDFSSSDWTCVYDANVRKYGTQMNNQPWGRSADFITVGATSAHSTITQRYVTTRFRPGEPTFCYADVARRQ